MKEYTTIEGFGNATYEIQKSRFLTYTAHVETEAEAREFVLSIKKKHFDARHNCSAWVLGPDSSLQKSNDDGEPGGTAGNPILEAIKQQHLTKVAVVVTRYFGGIKLGAGGLIRAYNDSAAIGLDNSVKVAIRPFCRLDVTIDYGMLGTLENWIRSQDIHTLEADYTDKVILHLLIEPHDVENIQSQLTDMTSARCQLNVNPPEYLEVKI